MMEYLDLKEHGIRLYRGNIFNHDFLWFSSSEIAQVSNTWPILHNYALTYALGQFSHGLSFGTTPTYEEDLPKIPLHATPALNYRAKKCSLTFNAIDDLTQRTDTGGKLNTPSIATRIVIVPEKKSKSNAEKKVEEGYILYCFVWDEYRLPGAFRLGKKGCAMRAFWEEVDAERAVFIEEPVTPAHPVNPLDIAGELVWYEPVLIPPHMVFRRAQIKGDYFVPDKNRMVLLPKRIQERILNGNKN